MMTTMVMFCWGETKQQNQIYKNKIHFCLFKLWLLFI